MPGATQRVPGSWCQSPVLAARRRGPGTPGGSAPSNPARSRPRNWPAFRRAARTRTGFGESPRSQRSARRSGTDRPMSRVQQERGHYRGVTRTAAARTTDRLRPTATTRKVISPAAARVTCSTRPSASPPSVPRRSLPRISVAFCRRAHHERSAIGRRAHVPASGRGSRRTAVWGADRGRPTPHPAKLMRSGVRAPSEIGIGQP